MNARHPEYANFAAMAAAHTEGKDYDRLVRLVPGAAIVLVAPHGGRIEPETDEIAQELAGDVFSLYCFRSQLSKERANLHIASHRFDDPSCLALVAKHRTVVAVHGWRADGERVLVGGLDAALVCSVLSAVRSVGVEATAATAPLSGTDALNICNRGNSGRGVQLEMTKTLRRGPRRKVFTDTVRHLLLERQGAL